MNSKTQESLIQLLNNKNVWKVMKKEFDRSFQITAIEKDGKVIIQFAEADNGRDFMTTADVAAYLDKDSRTIRRWCETRAQRQSTDPIPFFRMYGVLRFERAKIAAWQKRLSDAPVVLPPLSGKKRKTVRVRIPLEPK